MRTEAIERCIDDSRQYGWDDLGPPAYAEACVELAALRGKIARLEEALKDCEIGLDNIADSMDKATIISIARDALFIVQDAQEAISSSPPPGEQ